MVAALVGVNMLGFSTPVSAEETTALTARGDTFRICGRRSRVR
jgi:hypothetical protein